MPNVQFTCQIMVLYYYKLVRSFIFCNILRFSFVKSLCQLGQVPVKYQHGCNLRLCFIDLIYLKCPALEFILNDNYVTHKMPTSTFWENI